MNKDMKKLIKSVEAQGFSVRISSKGHILFSDTTGRRVATAAGTSSDRRAWANMLSELKRAGYSPEG